MTRPQVLTIAVLGALLAGCTAHGSQPSPGGPAGRPGGAVVTDSVPGCTTATAPGPDLHGVATALAHVGGPPFGVLVSRDGQWSFVALPGSVAVFRNSGHGLPRLVRTVRATGASAGAALSGNGRYLLVADGSSGAIVVDVARAKRGAGNPVLGTLSSRGGGAIEVALSRDDRFAFVSLEGSRELAVFDLSRALTGGFGPADLVGYIPVGVAPVGMAVSPDGRWLYATSEASGLGIPAGGGGTLSVISVARAERDPAKAVLATVTAGCNPVRVITAADGTVIWVTARGSNALLAFSATLLRSSPRHALIADIRVGEAPVGLALVRDGTRIVVADSNRFGVKGARSSLAVISVPAALARHRALVGYLPAGGFPREMALQPGGQVLLVANYDSQQLEAVTVASLP